MFAARSCATVVSQRGSRPSSRRADAEAFAVGEQMIERGKLLLEVEHLAEDRLHLADALADRDAAAELGAQERRGGQVVGVRVGLEDPLHPQAAAAHELDHAFGGARRSAPGLRLVVEHRVDDRRRAAVVHYVGDRPGGRVEEGLQLRVHANNILTYILSVNRISA
jgi:hypothetical protein